MTESTTSSGPSRVPRTSKEELIALGLTWLVPGLGHFYLGRRQRALFLFLVCNFLFALGIVLSGGAVFSMSGAASLPDAAPRVFLLLMMPIPEILNLGATLLSSYLYLKEAVVWNAELYPLAAWGTTLTGISGMLSLFVMVDAWTHALDKNHATVKPAIAAFLSWICPGAGHWYLGNRFKFGIFFFSIQILFLAGFVLGSGLVINRERFFYYWAGQGLNGGVHLTLTLLTGGARFKDSLPLFDLGILYTTVAGLLNVVTMLSAYTDARKQGK